MKTFRVLSAVAGLLGAGVLLSACDKIPGLNPKFGNFGGGQEQQTQTPPAFDPKATKFGIRWFPTHVHFGPDGDTLLVSLCHVSRSGFCRIGKYSISRNHWDILPFEENRTYWEPIYSRDGQWIAYSSAPCQAEMLCDSNESKLFRTTPDGSKTELVAETVASHPSFSIDGKKLIYWRQNIIQRPDQPKFAAGMNLYQLDWETKKETALTDFILFPGEQRSRPFFLPGGEKFVFSLDPYAFRKQDYEMASKSSGPHPPYSFFIGSMTNIPIGPNNYKTLEAYAKKETEGDEMLDMDREGRILYKGHLGDKKKEGNPVALALRPRDPTYQGIPSESAGATGEGREQRYPYEKLTEEQFRQGEGARLWLKEVIESYQNRTGEGKALFLRKPGANARDEAAIDIDWQCAASLSPDGSRLAFIWDHCALVGTRTALGLINRDQPMKDIQFINWPKIDLTDK